METKPSYLTSEFWTMLITNIGGVLNLLGWWKFVPNTWATIAMSIITGLYAVGRGHAKQGVGFDPVAYRHAKAGMKKK